MSSTSFMRTMPNRRQRILVRAKHKHECLRLEIKRLLVARRISRAKKPTAQCDRAMPTNSNDVSRELAPISQAREQHHFWPRHHALCYGWPSPFRRAQIAVKVISPLLGFNNNVKHKGRTFHVQTEDSGVRHPHVITHLFADGGRILKSLKTSYAEHLNEDNLRDIVHQLMKEQHKAMFVALRDGQFDHIFEDKDAATQAAAAAANAAAQAAAAAAPPPSVAAPSSGVTPAPPTVAVPVLPGSSKVAPPVSSGVRPVAPEIGSAKNDGVDLELRGIDKSSIAVESAPPDLSPPPSAVKQGGALFTAGVYRTMATASATPPSGGRYAPARQPSIFGSSRPAQNVSIFGEDLISEKSLDEVILSYLAEDLENEEGV